MQRMEQATELGTTELSVVGASALDAAGTERKRVEAVVETLATLRGRGESLAEAAHDARNMVTALGLYCDLLEEPGVLATSFGHYANELRLVATASRRLVEKLLALDSRETAGSPAALTGALAGPVSRGTARTVDEIEFGGRNQRARRWDLMPAEPIGNLAAELLATRNLLAALAGPGVALTVDAVGGALAVRLSGEDLTRILVNLVKNSAEAMQANGRIVIELAERPVTAGTVPWLVLTVEDSGPGIPRDALEKVFDAGYTNQPHGVAGQDWPRIHRGLGLSITRSIIEAAGGRVHAGNRAPGGARIEIELPVWRS
jgi:two-component system sensor histidine kinase ChvG